MGLIRFLVDSPMISQEIILSDSPNFEKLSILVGGNGGGKTAILSLIETHHRFLENLAVQLRHPHHIDTKGGDIQGNWNIYYNENIVLDEQAHEQERYEQKYYHSNLYDNDLEDRLGKVDFSNWIFLKEFYWINGGKPEKRWRVELDYENDLGAWKIQFNHHFYENSLPDGVSIPSTLEMDEHWGNDGNTDHQNEFKGIQTNLRVTFDINPDFIFDEIGVSSDYLEEFLVLHSRLYPGDYEPFGEIIFLSPDTHGALSAIPTMINLIALEPVIPTSRLEGIRKGSSPLQLLQYLYRNRENRGYGDIDANIILRDAALPGEEIIKKVKDSYHFITGEICHALRSEDAGSLKSQGGYRIAIGTNPDFQYLSSGQQHLLLLLMRICASGRHSLLLLDEIELGLHEGYLERLSILMDKNKEEFPQMVVSTHSPIFAGLNLENTHFIEKNGAGQ